MKLQPDPFDKIKAGSKLIEVRLFDEKRQQLQIGDEITFLKEPAVRGSEEPSGSRGEKDEQITVSVIGLLRYSTFSDLANDFPAEYFGASSKEDLINSVYKYYSKENESKYGVLGIRIKLK